MTAALSHTVQAEFTAGPFSLGAAGKRDALAVARHLAHDTRNWLTVLRVYCDMLRASGTVEGGDRQWVEELSSAVERGHGLVVSLLDSVENSSEPRPLSPDDSTPSRPVDASRSPEPPNLERMNLEPLNITPLNIEPLNLKSLNLAAAIARQVPLLRRLAGDRIEFAVKTVVRAETMAIGETAFERILLNLARNAMEAMAAMPQGGKLKIALNHGRPSRLPGERSLVLRVSDTGPGIPRKHLPRIFDSGFSTKLALAGSPSGRGFGLAIVRELALAAGGSVRVRSSQSSRGHGSTFIVELPRIAQARATTRPVRSPRERKLKVVPPVPSVSNVATVSRKPKSAPRARRNNSGANRKGTRVPC